MEVSKGDKVQSGELFQSVLLEVGLNSESADGWVKVTEVLTSEYFKEITKEILMKAASEQLRPCHVSGCTWCR